KANVVEDGSFLVGGILRLFAADARWQTGILDEYFVDLRLALNALDDLFHSAVLVLFCAGLEDMGHYALFGEYILAGSII
ncbi:MAG: hypothetical protein IKN68_01550, partial [Spirochaetia bacterium]|nr:hypothetical protein [Spirochaetia bacterium]